MTSRALQMRVLRAQIQRRDPTFVTGRTLSLGDPRLDGRFPQGGLPLGAWHELEGEGVEAEDGACLAGFAARLLAPLPGLVVWISLRDDLYPPGLQGLGTPASRLVLVRARTQAEALQALEDAAATPGAHAAAEVESLDLTQGRRLQLAAARGGGVVLALKRRRARHAGAGAPRTGVTPGGSAAFSRWRIGPAPAGAVLIGETPCPDLPGLGAPRWRAALERVRGGRGGEWIVEASHGATPFGLVAELAHDPASAIRLRRVG